MAKRELHLLIFYLYIAGSSKFIGQVLGDDDDITIIPLTSYFCEDTEPLVEYDLSLRNINDNGDKLLDLEINLDDLKFSDNWSINLKIDQWNNGAWDENFYLTEGTACSIASQYASRAWKKLRDAIDPPMTGPCSIESGSYKLTSFDVFRDDYDIPVKIVGKYRVTAKVSDDTGAEVICQVFEVETDKAS